MEFYCYVFDIELLVFGLYCFLFIKCIIIKSWFFMFEY